MIRILCSLLSYQALSTALVAAVILCSGEVVTADVVQNPISQFDIFVDGQFSGGVSGGTVVGEWSDVTPLAFVSPPTPNGTLKTAPLGDPRVNSLLYAAIAPGQVVNDEELYLMYDYLPRTNPFFFPGEFIADIVFPISNVPGFPAEQEFNATVQFRGADEIIATLQDSDVAAIILVSPFDVFVELEGVAGRFDAEQFGIEGAIGFGPSTLSETAHLLVELEVSLNTPAEFLGPNDQGHNGVYSPDPAFWGANITNDAIDPPASAAIFTIMPGGATIANSNFLPSIPEPTGLTLAALAATGLLYRRRTE